MIFEKETLKEIYEYLDQDTLLVLDLDNTLIESASHYGSYQWGNFLTKRALQEGLCLKDALKQVMPIWEKAQHEIEVKPIEDQLHLFMESIDSIGVEKLALTGRSPQIAPITFHYLDKYNVNFSDWNQENLSFELPSEYLFQKGVFFAGTWNEKGTILQQLLSQLNSRFKKVVFVDDQMYLVEQVAKALQDFPIEYLGVRYSGADKKVLAFDYSIAESERKKFLIH